MGVVLKNEGSSQYRIQPGDKIVQMTVDLCLWPEVLVVQDLITTARGLKDWGSTVTPDLVVPPSPALPYTSPCTDDVHLIHSHCPPTIPWHNQFMPPFFLYFLYIVLGARERRLKTALHSPTQREREGPVTRAQAKLRHQVGLNSQEGFVGVFQSGKLSQEYETSPGTRLQPGTDDCACVIAGICDAGDAVCAFFTRFIPETGQGFIPQGSRSTIHPSDP